jgi:3-hydroxybutyryl-CoA dehydrogenase
MGPCGMMDMVGMKTCYDVSQYWGTVNNDPQMLKNAAYVKARFLDKGLQGMLGGKGFYEYPNPAYAESGFLAVPDASTVPGLVDRVMPA